MNGCCYLCGAPITDKSCVWIPHMIGKLSTEICVCSACAKQQSQAD